MKAAIYYGPHDIRVEEIERPEAGDDGIVVKVRAAGVCGSDLHSYKVAREGTPTERRARGHEVAGDVVEVGANVKDVEVGDRVWTWPILPCFECEWCKEEGYKKNYLKCSNIKMAGRGLHGGFAEYLWVPLVVLPQEDTDILPSVIKLPETMSYQDGVLIEPVTVGVNALNKAEAKTDDVVVVLGAGIIGLGTVIKAKDLGAAKIIVSDISEKRLQAAKELGANLTLNPTEEDIVKRVMEETSDKGADVVVETAGKPVTFLQSVDMVRRGGKIMIVAIYEESFEFNPTSFVHKAIRTIGCIEADWTESFRLIKAGKVKDKQVVSHVFPLDRINEAFETAINTKESIKVMIEP